MTASTTVRSTTPVTSVTGRRLPVGRAARAAAALALAVGLAACGGGDDPTVESQPEPAATQEQAQEPAAPECESVPPTAPPADDATTDLDTKPEVVVPEGPPPCDLVISDIVLGAGPGAQPGQTVEVKYVGVFHDSGEEFDSSWSRGDDETFPFTLGGQQVIQGWDEGLVGAQVGGRRQLVIPPDLAYGPGGRPGIPPNSTLVFVVDVVAIS